MNRIETVRKVVDGILLNITDDEERRCAYIHLYGVSQACAILAAKRGGNAELAVISGMLHDIYTYAAMDSADHAHKGAIMAKELLTDMDIFDDNEIDMICTAIYNHSDKKAVHDSMDELLKDTDVMQHALYDPTSVVKNDERERFDAVARELGIAYSSTL